MRRFEVIQGERVGSSPCGELTYDAGSGQFEFAAADGAGSCDVPAMFAPFVAQGTHVPGHWVNAWAQERIAPPSRQNIGQILREHGLDAYDPCALLMAHGGRSTQDGFYRAFMGVQHLLCAAVRSAVRLIILFAQNGQCDGRQRRRDHINRRFQKRD